MSSQVQTASATASAERHVDQEQPVPGVMIGQPAAERRADGRRQRRGEPDQHRHLVRACPAEQQEGGGEHGRDHGAADEALRGAEDDHRAEAGGAGAEQRRTA